MLYLARLIRKAYRSNGVVTAYVYGEFGYGKTSYALWVARDVYEDWDKALEHLVFKPEDALEIIGGAVRRGKRIPLIIMDDAGLWLDRLTWWEKSKVRFMELFNLIRSVAAGVIFTTPSKELPSQLANKLFYRVRVETVGNPEDYPGLRSVMDMAVKHGLKPYISKATGYKLKTLPKFFHIVKKTFYDYYPTHYPVFKEYEKKRKDALRYYYNRLEELYRDQAPDTFDPEDRGSVALYVCGQLRRGRLRGEIARELVEAGLPRSTAYYYISRAKRILKAFGTCAPLKSRVRATIES